MSNSVETSCCIVGGEPAGMMPGLRLARAGVVVMAKHGDFAAHAMSPIGA